MRGSRTRRTPGRSSALTRSSTSRPVGVRQQIGLVDHHQIGGGKLLLEQLGERALVVERGVGQRAGPRALRGPRRRGHRARPRRRPPRSTASTVTRVRISGQLKALIRGFGSARPEVSITMCSGGSRALEQPPHGRHEVIGDGAADAAIGELDDVVLGAGRIAAAEQQLAIDPDVAELVDDQRDAAGRRSGATGCWIRLVLPAAEEAGEHGGRDFAVASGHAGASDGPLHLRRWGGRRSSRPRHRPLGNPLMQPAGMIDERARHRDRSARRPGRPRSRPAPAAPASPGRTASSRSISASTGRSPTIRLVSHKVRQSTRTARPGAHSRRARRPGRAAPRRSATSAPRRARCGAIRAAISSSSASAVAT